MSVERSCLRLVREDILRAGLVGGALGSLEMFTLLSYFVSASFLTSAGP
jgi:hypothetical protein